jgi:phosphate transport system permease protein
MVSEAAKNYINKKSFSKTFRGYLKNPLSLFLAALLIIGALITFFVLLYLIIYILIKGVPYLTPELFELTYNTENVSMFPALINTITMTLLSLLIAAPLGLSGRIRQARQQVC